MSPVTPAPRAAVKALGTAIAAILTVAGLALAAGPSGRAGDATELQALLTATAHATESVGSARVDVTGSAVVKVRLDLDRFLAEMPSTDEFAERFESELPQLPPLPSPGETTPSAPEGDPELFDVPALPEPDCTGLDEHQCAAFQESHRQAAEAIGEEMRGRVEAGLDGAREQLSDQLARAQADFERQLAEIPREFTCRFSFTGSGTLAIPGQAEIGGDADVSCDPETTSASGSFHAVISHDVTYTDNGDGTFTAAPTGGDIGALVARAEDLAGLLDNPQGTATDHGTETLDGDEVRHVSFTVDGGAFAPVDGATASVDVWIGVHDHILRKAVVRSSGAHEEAGVAVEWTAEQTVVVTGVDAPVEITPPSPDQVTPAPPAAEQFQGMTSPFGATLPAPFAGWGGV